MINLKNFYSTKRRLATSLFIIFVFAIIPIALLQNKKLSNSSPVIDSTCYRKEKITQDLQLLSFQEKLELDALFRWLFFWEGFAYTLFDERALAFTTYSATNPWGNIMCNAMDPPAFFWWKTWEKYKNLFPMERFALVTTEDTQHTSTRVYLINKKLYYRMLLTAQPDSKWVLNSGKSLNELKKYWEEFKIEELPNYSEILGILLGFGENNSYLFYRRDIIEQLLSPESPSYGIAVMTGNLTRLSNEFDQINNSLQGIQTHKKTKGITPLSPLYFAGDLNTKETQQLFKKYKKSRDKISRGYSQGSFLEVTLERLTSSEG